MISQTELGAKTRRTRHTRSRREVRIHYRFRVSRAFDRLVHQVMGSRRPGKAAVQRRGPTWVSDVTEHPTDGGKLCLAVVLDAWSRRVIRWSIADHIRSELVVDALQMAIWRRRLPEGKTICHTGHGASTRRGPSAGRLRAAGLLGSMGSMGDCFDNSLAESFFGTLQLELLDRHRWQTRDQLASAIF